MNTVFLLGDSTCAQKEESAYPETGWGMVFPSLIKTTWRVENLAFNGRSTKSFIAEGRFKTCLASLNAGDYVMIQFGHNDSKDDEERHTDPWTTYQGNLAYMAEKVLGRKAKPILVSSIARRRFDEEGVLQSTHGEYPRAMQALSDSRGYLYLDMTGASQAMVSSLGPQKSKELYLHLKPGESPNYPQGSQDDTHFNEYGADVMAQLVIKLLGELSPKLPFLL